MKGILLIALHIEHAHHASLNFQWDHDFGARLGQGIDEAITRILVHVWDEYPFSRSRGLPDQPLARLDLQSDPGLRASLACASPAFALSHGTRTKTQRGGLAVNRKHSHVIIVKRLLYQFGNTSGQFIDAHGVRDLRTHFTHEIQLVESESFHGDAMGSDETNRNHSGQTLKEIQFLWFEIRAFEAGDLKRSQCHPLIFERDRGPRSALTTGERSKRAA